MKIIAIVCMIFTQLKLASKSTTAITANAMVHIVNMLLMIVVLTLNADFKVTR